jgi:hypothetical protein
MSTDATIAIIVASFSLIGTAVTLFITARKNDVEILRGIIDELRDELDALKRANRNLKKWAQKLVAQIKELGGEPCEYEEEE